MKRKEVERFPVWCMLDYVDFRTSGACHPRILCQTPPSLASCMNRIDAKFQSLNQSGKKALIAYITAGDPSLEATRQLAIAFEKVGVDILELGVPFSDPLADGVVNQLAAQRALEAGATVRGVLETIRSIRESSELPLVLFTYLNPIYRYGFEKFVADAALAGADGILILDLPPDEAALNAELAGLSGLKSIRLVAPTTPPARMAEIVRGGGGFVYYVSREGVTGEQTALSDRIASQVQEIRRHTPLPIAVGFGISTPDQAEEVAASADAVVVGSAIVKRIAELGDSPELFESVPAFVKTLVDAVKKR